jgi:hypothetical protein
VQALSLPNDAPGPSGAALAPAPGPDDALALTDLHLDLAELRRLTLHEAGREHWVDAFLLAAGAGQVVEDHLQGVGSLAHRAAGHYRAAPGALGRQAGRILERGTRLPTWVASAGSRFRNLSVASTRLAEVVEALCAAAFGATAPEPRQATALVAKAGGAFDGLEGLPVWHDIMRLPSCFRSFDQRPEDMAGLVEAFSARHPERDRPVAVVGVRTSGSYLAPICAQHLRAIGYGDVRCVTVRPGYPPRHPVAAAVGVDRSGGTVVVVDDPPVTGHSVRSVVEGIERLGVPRQSIVVLRACVEETAPPHALADLALVDLPWTRWEVLRRLRTEAVARALTALVAPGRLRRVEPADPLPVPHRGHLRRRFVVEWTPTAHGPARRDVIVAESTGFGYLGRHALAVAGAIPQLTPPVIGWHDGLLLRRWLPDHWRMADLATAAVPVATHVARRHRALRVNEDRSRSLRGRQPAWEVAADRVGRSLGRFSTTLRPALVDPVVRRVLSVAEPSVVDGAVDPRHWFVPDPGGVALKVGAAEGAFGHLDLSSYDPVFDLAGVAALVDDRAFTEALRDAFEGIEGSVVEPERWMLLSLVHLWNAGRLGTRDPRWVRRASSRVLQRYFAARFLDDLGEVPTGPWCAVDLDGVLETAPLGFPATTRLGALGLRALRAHGFRLLLATGRSVGEVVERCAAYGLDGGVAEYGAAAYDARSGAVTELGTAEAAGHLAAVRARVAEHPDLVVDPDFTRIVRVCAPRGSGLGTCPSPSMIAALLVGHEGAVIAVSGDDQVDLVPTGVDKGRGLRHLLGRLDGHPPGPTPLALAVGDASPDLAMLALAEVRLAPAHARSLARRGVALTARPYQAGFFDAVSSVVGHRPGACARCALPDEPPQARALLTLLSCQEAGARGAPRRLARLALGVLAGRRSR